MFRPVLSAYPSSAPIPAFCVVAAFLVAAAGYFLPRTRHAWGGPVRAFRRLSAPARILALLLLAAATVVGGGKAGGGGGLPQQPPPALPSGGAPEGRALPAATAFSPGDLSRGFVLARVGTNELHAFDPPPGATVCERWRRTGSATGWIPVSPDAADWAFPVGTNLVARFRVFAFGRVDPLVGCAVSANFRLSPLDAPLGIVSAANWPLLSPSARPSQFWHHFSPSNSLLFTWQNALLGRQTNAPVSFQAELFPSGRFDYRYDFSGIAEAPSGGCGLPAATPSHFLSGASFGGHAWSTNVLSAPSVTSLSFVPVSPSDLDNPDRDGDGLSTSDEIFLLGTDPDLSDTDLDGVPDGAELSLGTAPLSRDTDGDGLADGSDPDPLAQTPLADMDADGIPDAYETFWFGGTKATDSAAARDNTGFSLVAKIIAGICPTNPPSVSVPAFTNALYALKLFDGFSLDPSLLPTNLVFERTFAVARTSPWQQFFLSSSPTSAAPWEIRGGALEWQDDTGASGALPRSPAADSFRIPLGCPDARFLTLRVRAATGGPVSAPKPLYLLSYAPEMRVRNAERAITLPSGRTVSVFTSGSRVSAEIAIDRSRRPCRAPLCDDERSLEPFEREWETSRPNASFFGDHTGGTLSIDRPGVFSLPAASELSSGPSVLRAPTLRSPGGCDGPGHDILFLSPRIWLEGDSCHGYELKFDWETGTYSGDDPYPLDASWLRRSFRRSADGAGDGGGIPAFGPGTGDGVPDYVRIEDEPGEDSYFVSVYVGDVLVWTGELPYGDENCDPDETGDPETGCGCESGNCDATEGPGLGSLAFRVPLGAPRKGQISGFLYFKTEVPIRISPSSFRLLSRSDASVSDTVSGTTRRIVCHDGRGRDLAVDPVPGGVRITIRTTSTQALEHTWDLTNPGGDPSVVRLVKTSRAGNTMEDGTYVYRDGNWARTDNMSGLVEELEAYDDTGFGGEKAEIRTIRDPGGALLGVTRTYLSRVGECDNALLRETYREEDTGTAVHWERRAWWDDPRTQRHGRLRLRESNDGPWQYRDYDALGREVLRIEQRNGSPLPAQIDAGTVEAQSIPQGLADAFVTISGYERLPGDSNHPDDHAKPRLVEQYAVENGVATLVSRTWRRYTRSVRAGGTLGELPVAAEETWRAASPSSAFGDPSNACSYVISLDENAEGVPIVARGLAAETLDENGILTVNAYSLSGGVLSCETRRYATGGSPSSATEFPTYETMDRDATHGTVLRSTTRLTATDTVIADEINAYDEKNRLRSTTYLDGTSLTNAYSCCRLLSSTDREGRTTLRSAQTGTDHLYYAIEDIWLANLSTNGAFRVTQHFFDALGRETNTVTRTSTTPGGANRPGEPQGGSGFQSAVSISYPDGGSDYAIRTDERGAVSVTRTDLLPEAVRTTEILSTNGIEVLRTVTTTLHGGATTTRREWQRGGGLPSAVGANQRGGGLPSAVWTSTTSSTSYLPTGHRVETTVTTASDAPAVTNSVATYDLLGRLVATLRPGANGAAIATTNLYDGASSRILSSTTTGSPTIFYDYNARGERISASRENKTAETETTYETDASNIVWRIETAMRITGSVTNSVRVRRTQLTGLFCDGLRSRIVEIPESGIATTTESSFDPASGILQTRSVSVGTTPVVAESKFGLGISETTQDGTRTFAYDAFGRNCAHFSMSASGITNRIETFDHDVSGNVVRHFVDLCDGRTGEWTALFDALNRETSRTDALDNATSTGYDPLDRPVSADGDTYPLRYGYDTSGRKNRSATTRDGGENWDETSWNFDAASGLCTNKTYADGSRVSYDYTDNGRRIRTTWARGAWKQNAWNDQNLLSGTTYSGTATPSVAYTYHDSDKLASATLSDGTSYAYAYDDRLLCTNETVTLDDKAFHVVRTYDAFRRAGETSVVVTNARHAAKIRLYDSENRISGYALTNSAGRGVSVSFAYDGSYVTNIAYALPSGAWFTVALSRDPARKYLVTRRDYAFNLQPVFWYSTEYDILDRPTSAMDSASLARSWTYNNRSELAAATIGTNRFDYAFDTIGNRDIASANAATNAYAANGLNQYVSISNLCVSAPLREINPTYDADGNLLRDGLFRYAYDAENRMIRATSLGQTNDSIRVLNAYDHTHRRTKKTVQRFAFPGGGASSPGVPPMPQIGEWITTETHTYVWDGNNIVLEKVEFADGSTRAFEYFWGPDLSGTEQGAGGVGGLLAVSIDGAFHIPCYDHNGNIVRYVSETGTTSASYAYDPFGSIISSSGPLADAFTFGFSTKPIDPETGLVAYQRRFYNPAIGRFLNRDPIEEEGGENLYAFCHNAPSFFVDSFGESFKGYFIDAAKMLSGAFTAYAGAVLGVSLGWSGAGAIGAYGLVVMGSNQFVGGAVNLAKRMLGADISDDTPIQVAYRTLAEKVTGHSGSSIEKTLDAAYFSADVVSACATGRLSIQSSIFTIRNIGPAKTIGRWVIQDGYVRYQFRLQASISVVKAAGVVVTETFSTFLSGVSFFSSKDKATNSSEYGD